MYVDSSSASRLSSKALRQSGMQQQCGAQQYCMVLNNIMLNNIPGTAL
jgi:hypothetical protein